MNYQLASIQPTDEVSRLILALYLEPSVKNSMVSDLIRAQLDGVGDPVVFTQVSKLITEDSWRRAEREISQCAQRGLSLICPFSPSFPAKLAEISHPPPVLYVQGVLPASFGIGIVGSRAATAYGQRIARKLAEQTVRAGGAVISGLAFGIDRAAHEGAIEAALTSVTAGAHPGVAVLGSGLMNVQPTSHRGLSERLLEAGGAMVSEYFLEAPGLPENFPRRNRIISALSDAVVVVEAKEKSGALITARHALEQARPIFAVPGSIESAQSAGCNQLLFDGARVVRSLDDVLSAVPELRKYQQPAKKEKNRRVPREHADVKLLFEQEDKKQLSIRIIAVLDEAGIQSFDCLVLSLGTSAALLNGVLAIMELNGWVFSPAPNCWSNVR